MTANTESEMTDCVAATGSSATARFGTTKNSSDIAGKTIEPMITLGGADWDLWDDGWTVTTKDKSWCAQFEHTVLMTDEGPEILTLP